MTVGRAFMARLGSEPDRLGNRVDRIGMGAVRWAQEDTTYRMPWKETCPMDQRVALIADWLRDEWTMSELAERYGISRKTPINVSIDMRPTPHGGLRAIMTPHARPDHSSAEVREACWRCGTCTRIGGRKSAGDLGRVIRDGLAGREHHRRSLRRERLAPRRRIRYTMPLTQLLATAQAPNDVDRGLQGLARTADGTRCDPLTVIDAASRFVLCCRIVQPQPGGVRPWFERAFATYGPPRGAHGQRVAVCHNRGAHLSHLAVWLKLGIQLDRIDRGHPEQNGRHERFHLTQQETTATRGDPSAQQWRFDRLRREFNPERPHEALDQQPPPAIPHHPDPTPPSSRAV